MDIVINFVGYFLIYFSFYKIYYIVTTKRKKEFISSEVIYLVGKYKLNLDKIGYSKLLNIVTIANALLFATAITFVSSNLFDSMIISFIIVFVAMIPIIYVVYHLIGSYFSDKY